MARERQRETKPKLTVEELRQEFKTRYSQNMKEFEILEEIIKLESDIWFLQEQYNEELKRSRFGDDSD